MQRIFLFAATLFLIAQNTMASQPIAKNPLAGNKLNQRLLESRMAGERASLLLGRVGATSSTWFPDSARQSMWDQSLNQYTLQSNVHFSYNSFNELDTISYYFDYGIGLQLLSQEVMNWQAAGKLTDYHYFENQGAGMEEVYRFEMKYDSQGFPQSRIHYVADPGMSMQSSSTNWMPVFGDSIVASYSPQGHVTSLEFHLLDFFGGTGWMTIMRNSNITYNNNGHPTSMIVEEYDPISNTFVNPIQYGNMNWGFGFTNWSEAFGMTNPFLNDFAIFPQAEFFLMQPTSFTATQAGVNHSRSLATLQNGLVERMVLESWTGSAWVADQRFEVKYQGNRLSHFIEMMPNANGWDSVYRNFFSYDSQGRLLEVHEAGYDASAGWVISDGARHAYTFSNNKPESVETTFWNSTTGMYEAGRLIEYVFVPGSTASTPTLQLLEVSAWPNPTEGELKLQLGESFRGEKAVARIVNLNGQTLSVQQISGHETETEFSLSMEQLPAGLYFVQLSTARAQQNLRILKK